jgi:hypothetical protein
MPNLALDSLWPGLVAWIVLYISDYTLTIVCARMYQAGVKNKIVIDGSYEITPYYQADVNALRRVSPRFLVLLVFGCAAIVTIWYASQNGDCSPSLYAFVVGSMILVELAVHVRHCGTISIFGRCSAMTMPSVEELSTRAASLYCCRPLRFRPLPGCT